ncbi:hypothetical protein VTO42DRAFT_4281 [Malbranchea cinnamomea]
MKSWVVDTFFVHLHFTTEFTVLGVWLGQEANTRIHDLQPGRLVGLLRKSGFARSTGSHQPATMLTQPPSRVPHAWHPSLRF